MENKLIPGVPLGLDVNSLSNTSKIPDNNRTLYGSTPNSKKTNTSGTKEYFKALGNELRTELGNMNDPNEYGKVYAYDNSPSGPSFRARYKAYGQETFNKIGFDPHIDNEAVYNQNTNTFDDMKRWATNSALPMLSLGFMSPINSYAGAIGTGDLGPSLQEAKDYEYYNALGYSSKGGLGGFATNMLNSVSYSAGILLEGVAEGMAIGAGVGFLAGEGIGAIPGAAIGGMIEGVRAFTKIPKALYQSVSSLGKINTAIKELKNINNAKNFFTTVGKGTGKFLNPLENTYDAYKQLKEVDDITRLAKTAKTAGAFWHDVMGINMALSEGRLEGGFAQQNVYNKLYNEHYAKYGKAPSPEEQERMMSNASQAGYKNTLYNAGLVFYSNKIAFPSITRAGFLKGVPRFNVGKVVGEVGKEFQIVFNPADDVSKAYYSKEAISLKNSLKALKSPKKLGAIGVNYFKKNLVEGLQEVGQEALAMATEKYYTDTYNNPAARSYMYGFGALLDGVDKQLSAQGAEIFGTGFLMGSLLEGPSKLFKFGTKNFSRLYTDKAVYEENLKQREAQADNIVNALNNMHKNAKHFFDPRMNNYATQMLVAKAVDNPDTIDKKTAKDLEFQGFQSSVLTSLRTGTFDIFIKNLGEYKTLSPEELEQAWSLEPGQGQKALENIDKAIDSAKVTEARFKYAKDKFKDFVDLTPYKEGSPEYQTAAIYNQAYLESINSFVFLQDSFDNGLNRLQKLYSSANKIKSLSTSPFANFSILSDPSKLNAQIQYLQEEIDSAVSMNDPKLAEEIGRKRTLLSGLIGFNTFQETLFSKSSQEIDIQELELDLYDYFKAFKNLTESIALNNKEDGAYEDRDSAIAKLNAEIDNNGGIEDLFSNLVDIHQLRKENTFMAKYVNMLADPQGFYEHINRNVQWMKNLYNNRKEYYKEIVNKEITDSEKNEVLNALASQGIFVDLDEFAEWCNNPEYLPSYFIDTTKEMIINQDSILYSDYARIFTLATRVLSKAPAGDPLTEKQKLDSKIDELKKERADKLNALREAYEQQFLDEVGKPLNDVEYENEDVKEKNAKLEETKKTLADQITLLNDALETLNKNNPLEINKAVQKLVDNGIISAEELNDLLTVDGENPDVVAEIQAIVLRINTVKGITEPELLAAAVSVRELPEVIADKILENNDVLKEQPIELFDIEGTKAFQVYTEGATQINNEYDKYEDEVKQDFANRGINENTPDSVTTSTPYENMPDELKASIDAAFDQFLIDTGDNPSMKSANPVEYERQRSNWIELNGAELINAYNEKAFAEAKARAEKLKEPPFLKYNKKQVSKSDTVSQLNALYKVLNNLLTTGKDADGKEVKLSDQQKADLKEDLENLAGYLDALAKAYKPKSVAQKVVDIVQERILNRRSEVEDVVDAEGRKTRKFAGEETPTDIERKSGESIEDFINRLFENNYFVEVDGKQLFSLTQGRWGVVVNIGGIKVPFYQSTSGTDTKVVGQWYPFFGDQGNWVIKGNSDDSNVGYGFKAIQDVQSFLNKNIKETDAIALSNLVPTEVNQNKEDLRKLNESQIKANDNLSISKEATAKRLSELMGYTVEEASKTKSDAELFDLASKKVFAELAALEGNTTTTDIEAKKADIEKEIKEALRNTTNANGVKPYDNPDIQYELEIAQASRNIANALSKGQPLTFEFLKANLGGIFTTTNNNVIKVSINKGTGKIELSELNTVRTIIVDENNNISYDFEDKGKELNLKAARAISQAESKYQYKLKDIFKKYKAELDALGETAEAPVKLRRVSEIASKIAKEKLNFEYNYNKKPLLLRRFESILENETDKNKAVSTFMALLKKYASEDYKQFDSKRKLDAIEAGLRKNPTVESLGALIDEYAFIESTEAGTKVDELIRKFLTLDSVAGEGFTNVGYEDSITIAGVDYKVSDFMSRKAFDRLFGPGGIVSSIRSKMIDGEFVLFPENLLVFDKTLGITGEIDLLAVNSKGEVMIIDIKTSKNWDTYEKDNSYKRLSHRAQLSIYSTLFYNMTGIKPNRLAVLPLGIDVDVEGYVKDIDKAKVPELDEKGETIKIKNPKTGKDTVKRKYLSKGYYDLEFLDTITEEGVVMIQPEFETELSEEIVGEEGTEETPSGETILEETNDFDNLSLTDLLNKTIIFNGTTGKLIMLEDGSFAVEKTIAKDADMLQQMLGQFERDFDEETNPEIKKQIKSAIESTKAELNKKEKVIEVVYHNGKPATNGALNGLDLGISIITGITFPFQVNKVNGRVIKAEFTNEDESKALINGVEYTVIRDKSGAIAALSYRRNDSYLNEIDEEIDYANSEINRLSQLAKPKDIKKSSVAQYFLLNKIAELRERVQKLEKDKQSLLDTNDIVLVKGGNSNDYIFALNVLPNSFQKATKSFKPQDEKKHLKEMDRLSLSAAVSKAITEILDTEEYPETLDILFEVGVQGIAISELDYIYKWIDKKVDELYALGASVINRGDLVDDISNQINGLLQLKNDLNLIKIIKDGKTKKPRFSKQQAAANKVFGTKEVQKRTSVPKNEKPAGRQAETVSGLSEQRETISTEELKDLVSNARSVKPTVSVKTSVKPAAKPTSTIFNKIESAKTEEELKQARDEAYNKRGDVKISEIDAAYTKRLEELQTLSINTIKGGKEGTLLITKKPIFDMSKNVVVRVSMIIPSSNQIVVTIEGSNTKKTLTEEQLQDSFIRYTKEAMEKSSVVEPVTETQKEKAVISKSSITELGTNPELLNKAKEDAKKDSASRFSALKQASNNNNINNCD